MKNRRSSHRAPATPSGASAAALALATTFRAFDPKLDDGEIAEIARMIDANRATGAQLNADLRPLRNADEMVARFAAGENVRA